ncbi:MAG: FGGY family carbohydrate kinase [Oscillospiraceae bacterium]
MKKCVMGIDIGTTGVKAVVLDLLGNVLGKGYREYPLVCDTENRVTCIASSMMDKMFDAVKEAVTASPVPASDISAISFSVQRSSFFMMDEQLKPINDKLCVWLDTRSLPIMDEVRALMSTSHSHQISGIPCSPYGALSKVYFIKTRQPEIFEKTKFIATVDAYAMHCFGSDRFVSETSTAEICGLVDIRTFDWCDEILDAYGIPRSMMPELVKPGEIVGTIKQDISERTGLSVGTLIIAGSGDQQAGSMGCGIVNDGDMSLTLGTVGMLVVGQSKPDISKMPGLMIVSTPKLEIFEIEGNQVGGATNYRWARDTFCAAESELAASTGKDVYELMEQYIAESGPGANGVMFYPGLFGSGYPKDNGNISAAFVGLRSNHTRSDMLRAVMEGITLESRLMLESIESTGVHINESITISGGATKSPAWRQIIADIMNKQVCVLEVSDASIIGVAIIAGVGAGLYKDLADGVKSMIRIKEVIDPIPENASMYKELFEIYKDLYLSLDGRKISERLRKAVVR